MKTNLHIRHTKKLLLALAGMAALMACQPKDVLQEQVVAYDTIRLLISCPQAQMQPRFGDPGSSVPETADWDTLSLIFVYTETPYTSDKKVVVNNIRKTDFDTIKTDTTGFKLLPLKVQLGKAYIYGVTYSTGVQAADELENAINACTTEEAVKALTISNDYAKGDMNKFVSVATGYYKDNDGKPKEYDITGMGTGVTMPTMTLTRLASKIDIQWDAVDAYDAGYTDVKVTGFTVYNNKDNTTVAGSGSGRLFPALNNTSDKKIAGTKTFYNTSAISQRNGRVYHYMFPDGVSVPSVTFNIDAEKSGTTIPDDEYSYTLNFPSALQQATWYKVNATIKGITGGGTITLQNNP